MIGIIVLCVLCTVTVLFSFLTLAAIGRLLIEQRQSVDALVNANNVLVRRIDDFSERLDGALDCLILLDAFKSDSSAEVNGT